MRKNRYIGKILSVCIMVCMISGASVPVFATGNDNTLMANRVINPGFEFGSTSWNLGSNWLISSADKNSGSYSLLCNGQGNWSCSTQIISVTANSSITFTFNAKCSQSTYVKILAGATYSNVLSTISTSSDNQWHQYTSTFSNGNYDHLKIYFGDGGGTLYFDDISLTNGDAQIDANQNNIINSGFENSNNNWSLNSNWSISTADKYSGTYSLLCNGQGLWSNTSQSIPVAQNTQYVLTFYGKCSASLVYKIIGNDTGVSLSGTLYTSNNSLWTKYTATINSGSNKQPVTLMTFLSQVLKL